MESFEQSLFPFFRFLIGQQRNLFGTVATQYRYYASRVVAGLLFRIGRSLASSTPHFTVEFR